MGDTPAEGGTKKFGFLKTIGGAFGGLLSGAIMMYASPLIDKFVKPAKPIANFKFDAQGTAVTFHNVSTGANEGWWDFGDGSALEPVAQGQEAITHMYPSPGDFTAKLSVRNLLGDQDDRTTTLHLATVHVETPTISSFEVVPVSPGGYAPATFKVVSKVKGAQLCMLDAGDERELVIFDDPAQMNQEHLITFDKPGGYVVQMVAVCGTQHIQTNDIAQVNVAPKNVVAAIMTTTTQATRVETKSIVYNFAQSFPALEDSCKLDLKLPAESGYVITSVRLPSCSEPTLDNKQVEAAIAPPATCRGARNLQLQLSPDKKSVRLTGELVKESSFGKLKSALPSLLVPVTVVQEKRTPVSSPAVPVTAMLGLPGSVTLPLPPLPSDWVDARRLVRLELNLNDQTIWQGSQLPQGRGAIVSVGKKRLLLTATPNGEQVRLDLREAPPGYTAN